MDYNLKKYPEVFQHYFKHLKKISRLNNNKTKPRSNLSGKSLPGTGR